MSSTQEGVAANRDWRGSSAWSVGGLLLTRASTFATILVVVRLLTPSQFGLLNYAMTLAGLALMATALGYDTLMFRNLLRGSHEPSVASVYATKIRIGGVGVLILIALYFFSVDQEAWLLIGGSMVIGAALLLGLGETAEAVLAANHRYRARALVQAGPYLAALLAVAALSGVGVRGVGAFAACCGALAVRDVLRWMLGLRVLPPHTLAAARSVPWRQSRDLVVHAWPFAAVAALGVLYLRIDSVMLMAFSGPIELGMYSAAFNVYTGFFVFTAAVGPLVMQRIVDGPQHSLVSKMITTFSVLGAVLAVATWLSADLVVELLYGDDYEHSGFLLAVLGLALPFAYANSAALRASYVRGLERGVPLILGIALVATIGGNALLLPRYGASGAAATTVLTEIILLVGFLFLLHAGRSQSDGPATSLGTDGS